MTARPPPAARVLEEEGGGGGRRGAWGVGRSTGGSKPELRVSEGETRRGEVGWHAGVAEEAEAGRGSEAGAWSQARLICVRERPWSLQPSMPRRPGQATLAATAGWSP